MRVIGFILLLGLAYASLRLGATSDNASWAWLTGFAFANVGFWVFDSSTKKAKAT